MTWQRIDENTYIDDTLVTCAEYQLFIDEMREQGKYYQPDHWTSYQFPKGQAREPVFGVRPIDANAFCEWLVKREVGKWRYRLPRFTETINYLTKPYLQTQLGYWIWDIDAPIFVLIGDAPVVDYEIRANLAHVIDDILKLADATETARIANRDLEKDMEIGLDLNHTFEIVNEMVFDISNLIIPTNLAPNVFIPLSKLQNLISSLERICDRILDTKRDVDLCIADAMKILKEIDIAREHILNHKGSLDLTVAFELMVTQSLVVVVHLYILQERIAGRSPAFEGIRLVKERIR